MCKSHKAGTVFPETPKLHAIRQAGGRNLAIKFPAEIVPIAAHQLQYNIWMLRSNELECFEQKVDTFMARDLPNKNEISCLPELTPDFEVVRAR
jgi:hypothetical protein